jgi:hypothetical protein
MKTMPMGLISTQFISYHQIKVDNTDLYEDAWGFSSEFSDVIELLDEVKPLPEKRLTKQMIEKIRNEN